ncbi:MAG: cytidylate kinase-like family protein [Clostridiales bacterium]|nr:cytidylate kinase-like family protein [Clostridiales bacterium]
MAVKIITISRQFGSGGRTTGKQLAKDLGFDYYDREIIDRVAGETGFSKEYVAANSEYAPGKSIFSYSFEAAGTPGIMNGMTTTDYLYSIQRKKILEIANSGKNSIIVGRCADYILREFDDVLNVFIYADLEFRKNRVVATYGESNTKPEKRVIDKDKKRAANYKHYTDREWGMPNNYDICLNSGYLGIDKCVEIIKEIALNR